MSTAVAKKDIKINVGITFNGTLMSSTPCRREKEREKEISPDSCLYARTSFDVSARRIAFQKWSAPTRTCTSRKFANIPTHSIFYYYVLIEFRRRVQRSLVFRLKNGRSFKNNEVIIYTHKSLYVYHVTICSSVANLFSSMQYESSGRSSKFDASKGATPSSRNIASVYVK